MFEEVITKFIFQQNKNVVYYLFGDEEPLFTVKTLSVHPLFNLDTVFIAVRNPTLQSFTKLTKDYFPSLGVLKAQRSSDEEEDSKRAQKEYNPWKKEEPV